MKKRHETRIVVCDKCGIRTRHAWRQWERRSLLLRVIGYAQLVEGWVCTKCGRKNRVRQVGAVRASSHSSGKAA
jgi:hypothetical protein